MRLNSNSLFELVGVGARLQSNTPIGRSIHWTARQSGMCWTWISCGSIAIEPMHCHSQQSTIAPLNSRFIIVLLFEHLCARSSPIRYGVWLLAVGHFELQSQLTRIHSIHANTTLHNSSPWFPFPFFFHHSFFNRLSGSGGVLSAYRNWSDKRQPHMHSDSK